jgi:hypothetical protein
VIGSTGRDSIVDEVAVKPLSNTEELEYGASGTARARDIDGQERYEAKALLVTNDIGPGTKLYEPNQEMTVGNGDGIILFDQD